MRQRELCSNKLLISLSLVWSSPAASDAERSPTRLALYALALVAGTPCGETLLMDPRAGQSQLDSHAAGIMHDAPNAIVHSLGGAT